MDRRAARHRDDYLKRVGMRVRQERERRKLSLRQVARLCSLSHASVYELESGRNVSIGTAYEVALALSIPPGVVFNPFHVEAVESA